MVWKKLLKNVDSVVCVNLLKTGLPCMPKCRGFKYAAGILCERSVSTVDSPENESRLLSLFLLCSYD